MLRAFVNCAVVLKNASISSFFNGQRWTKCEVNILRSYLNWWHNWQLKSRRRSHPLKGSHSMGVKPRNSLLPLIWAHMRVLLVSHDRLRLFVTPSIFQGSRHGWKALACHAWFLLYERILNNIVYRRPGFLAVVWFGSSPTKNSPHPVSKLHRRHLKNEKQRQLTDWRGGKEVGEEPTARKPGPL